MKMWLHTPVLRGRASLFLWRTCSPRPSTTDTARARPLPPLTHTPRRTVPRNHDVAIGVKRAAAARVMRPSPARLRPSPARLRPLSRARIDERYRRFRSSPNDRSVVVPRRSREARNARFRRRCVPRRFSSESNARARESTAQCSPRTHARARRRRSRVTRVRESWRRTRA